MIILLKNPLKCDYICKTISKYLAKELKGVKDSSNYALTFNISEIQEAQEIKKIEKK